MLFDTHCHLNFKVFDKIVDSIITDAKRAGVTKILIPGTDLKSSEKAVEIAQKYEGIYAAVGVHPHHVFELMKLKTQISNVKTICKILKLDKIEEFISNKKVVAIGEIGLDRHIYQKTKYKAYRVDDEFLHIQKVFFVEQLKLAIKYKKAVIIHNRETIQEILQVLNDSWDDWFMGHMVFHCCEPDPRLLEFAIKHHIYIGVDGDVTYSKEKQKFIKKVPLELLVLETDSPFLAPVVEDTKLKFPNNPGNLKIVAEQISKLKSTTFEEIEQKTTENADRLFAV